MDSTGGERNLTIKVKFGDTIRRFGAYVNENFMDLNMSDLRTKIIMLFKLKPDAELLLTYTDIDGNLVTLLDDDELRDAAIQQRLNPLRINICVNDKYAGKKMHPQLKASSKFCSKPTPTDHINGTSKCAHEPLCKQLQNGLSMTSSSMPELTKPTYIPSFNNNSLPLPSSTLISPPTQSNLTSTIFPPTITSLPSPTQFQTQIPMAVLPPPTQSTIQIPVQTHNVAYQNTIIHTPSPTHTTPMTPPVLDANASKAITQQCIQKMATAATAINPFDTMKYPRFYLPVGFKFPKLTKYGGFTDPRHHLNSFFIETLLYRHDPALMINLFTQSLKGEALEWFFRLPSHEVQDLQHIATLFLSRYAHRKRRKPTLVELINEEPKPGESFLDFIIRWREMSFQSECTIPERQAVQLVITRAQGKLQTALLLSSCNTFDQLNEQVVFLQMNLDKLRFD